MAHSSVREARDVSDVRAILVYRHCDCDRIVLKVERNSQPRSQTNGRCARTAKQMNYNRISQSAAVNI
jgi:hypothetical protein